MKEYKTRLADSILQKKLASSGAVLIEGAKWCGKTTTASQIAKPLIIPLIYSARLSQADLEKLSGPRTVVIQFLSYIRPS